MTSLWQVHNDWNCSEGDEAGFFLSGVKGSEVKALLLGGLREKLGVMSCSVQYWIH